MKKQLMFSLLFLCLAVVGKAQTPNKLLFNAWQVSEVKLIEGFSKNPESLQKIMQKFQFKFIDSQKMTLINPTLQNPNLSYELKFSDANNFVATEITSANPKSEYKFKITKLSATELILEDQRERLKGTIWILKPLK